MLLEVLFVCWKFLLCDVVVMYFFFSVFRVVLRKFVFFWSYINISIDSKGKCCILLFINNFYFYGIGILFIKILFVEY